MQPPIPPTTIQLAYYGDLRAMVLYAQQLVKRDIVPRLGDMLPASKEDAARLDAAAHPISSIIASMLDAWHKRFTGPKISKAASKAAAAASQHSERQLFKQIKSGLGIQLESVGDKHMQKRLDDFTTENVALIKTVPEEYFGQVKDVVLAGIKAGQRADQVAADLVERGNVAENRAKLIARDQIGKFTGALTQARQTDLGVERFTWQTMGDERVRPAHAERNGKEYSWSNPPGDAGDPGDGATPGQGIQCRCFAAPVLSGILDALEGR